MPRATLARSAVTSLAFVLAGLLIGWLFFAGPAAALVHLGAPSVQAATDLSQFRDPANPDAPLDVASCAPYGVAVFPMRIHIECNMSVAPAPPFRFFAMGVNSSAQTARILSVLEAAHVAGKRLWIGYNPSDTTGVSIGCATNDCRLILSAAMQP